MKTCRIISANINVTSMDKTVKHIESNINVLRGEYICVSNVHTTVMSYDDDKYNRIQNEAYMCLPDGMPLAIVSKILGFKEAERVTGPDLMDELFKVSEMKGFTHYFYGSTEDTLEQLKSKLSKKYPDLMINGFFSPPFRELNSLEEERIVHEINGVEPDILWVGLGAPKQEIWMNKHKGKINSLMIGVGAGFDYHAENIKRAPIWMQNCSLEWLFRLAQDPKRLFKRYLTTNIKFIVMVLRQLKNSKSSTVDLDMIDKEKR